MKYIIADCEDAQIFFIGDEAECRDWLWNKYRESTQVEGYAVFTTDEYNKEFVFPTIVDGQNETSTFISND